MEIAELVHIIEQGGACLLGWAVALMVYRRNIELSKVNVALLQSQNEYLEKRYELLEQRFLDKMTNATTDS